jgi:hypothetical protein
MQLGFSNIALPVRRMQTMIKSRRNVFASKATKAIVQSVVDLRHSNR